MSSTINILHLTDLHYSKRDEHNQRIIANALMKDLEKLSDGVLKPDLLVFSGDLVNRADEPDVYGQFFDNVLHPLMTITKCSASRIVLTAGNHDAHRSFVEKDHHRHAGLMANLTNRDRLNEEYTRSDLDSFFAEKFQAFEDLRDLLRETGIVFKNRHATAHAYAELKLSVIEVNSSWMGYAGLKDTRDERRLLVPEAAIVDALERVPDGHAAILVTHHPSNWLAEYSETDFLRTIDGGFKLYLYGHMHEPRPHQIGTFKGSCLLNQGGALYAGRDWYIGYSLIRLDVATGYVEMHARSYSDRRREFHEASDLVERGIFHPSPEAKRHFYRQARLVDHDALRVWCAETVQPAAEKEFNEGLVDRPLCDIFVPPPLYTDVRFEEGEDEEVTERVEASITFDEVAASSANYVIYADPEYGKTTLLRQIALKLLRDGGRADGRPSVPVVINFAGLSKGDDRVERLLRSSMPDRPPHFQLAQLLDEGLVTVLVDDVVFTDRIRYPVLRNFVTNHPRNRYIFSTLPRRHERYLAAFDPELPVPMNRVFVKPLRRKDMRSLVEKWDRDRRLDREDVLNRVLNEIRNINIPPTAVNGTILLSIFEVQSDFTPINRAVLIERFVEALLEKRSAREIERRNFDFRMRVHYLAHVAAYMARNNRYVLDGDELRRLTGEYLSNLGLNQGTNGIINGFLDARIFAERADGHISFRYRAFLEYFVASQMNEDSAFRDWVISEENYLSFVNEIQYYAGIGRSDGSLLELIGARFEDLSQKLFQEIDTVPDPRSLENFRLPPASGVCDQLLEVLERQINAPPLTSSERDELLEADLPHDVEGRQEVFRPNPRDPGSRWFTGLVIYSNVLRNLELVPDQLKREHLAKVLEGWGRLLVASLWAVPNLAKQRRMKVNGVVYEVIVPREFTEAQVARTICLDLPNAISKLVWGTVGTEKLARQLTEPTLAEAGEPTLTRFFRQTLCMDLRLGDWWSRFDAFTAELNGHRYLLEATLWKANEIHALGALTDQAGVALRRTIGGLIANLRGGSRADRVKEKGNTIQRYERRDLVRRLRVKREDA